MLWFSSSGGNHCSNSMKWLVQRGVHCMRVISLSSSGITGGVTDNLWHSDISFCNQHRPVHQSSWLTGSEGNNPHDAQSAGLSPPSMWFHQSGIWSRISTSTNVLNLLGLPFNQSITIVLSDQVYVSHIGIWNTSFTWENKSANRYAPHSSNLGIVSRLIWANFVFKDIWIFLELSSNVKYVTAE